MDSNQYEITVKSAHNKIKIIIFKNQFSRYFNLLAHEIRQGHEELSISKHICKLKSGLLL